jgi:hypothetical protein
VSAGIYNKDSPPSVVQAQDHAEAGKDLWMYHRRKMEQRLRIDDRIKTQ